MNWNGNGLPTIWCNRAVLKSGLGWIADTVELRIPRQSQRLVASSSHVLRLRRQTGIAPTISNGAIKPSEPQNRFPPLPALRIVASVTVLLTASVMVSVSQ